MSNIFVLIGFFAVWIVTVSASATCDNLGILVYEDMNCKPIIRKGKSCPYKYECPDLGKQGDKCYFRGRSYQQGESVNSSETFCHPACYCDQTNEGMQFICAVYDCYFGGPSTQEGCYFKNTLESCCGESYCPTEPVHKCIYDGEEYREGERFFPKDSCKMCLCQKGFNGKLVEPFCIQRQCVGQIDHQAKIQKFCAPLYQNQRDRENCISCCPSEYTCPDGTEIITGKATSSDECRYGNKTLKIGQTFKKVANEQKISCKCTIPPLVSCFPET